MPGFKPDLMKDGVAIAVPRLAFVRRDKGDES